MPPKAKRYRVLVLDPLLRTWRSIATELTEKQANDVIRVLMWDAKKEQIND